MGQSVSRSPHALIVLFSNPPAGLFILPMYTFSHPLAPTHPPTHHTVHLIYVHTPEFAKVARQTGQDWKLSSVYRGMGLQVRP